jgi:hypothetical protein
LGLRNLLLGFACEELMPGKEHSSENSQCGETRII